MPKLTSVYLLIAALALVLPLFCLVCHRYRVAILAALLHRSTEWVIGSPQCFDLRVTGHSLGNSIFRSFGLAFSPNWFPSNTHVIGWSEGKVGCGGEQGQFGFIYCRFFFRSGKRYINAFRFFLFPSLELLLTLIANWLLCYYCYCCCSSTLLYYWRLLVLLSSRKSVCPKAGEKSMSLIVKSDFNLSSFSLSSPQLVLPFGRGKVLELGWSEHRETI